MIKSDYVYPATLLCDFYKISHREQYPKGTEKIYSVWTPRGSRIDGIDSVVAWSFQYFIKEYLMDYFQKNFFSRPKEDVVNEYTRVVKYALGVAEPDSSHVEALHDLGFIPLHIKAVKEGTLVPMRVPMLSIINTRPEFFWLTNYIETLFSCEVWQPITSATIAHKYHTIGAKYADLTVGNRDHLPYQFHDFSFRGMEGLYGGANSGAGHLLTSLGTDSIPSIFFFEKYYNANMEKEVIGTSIPATEHSVMCVNAITETRDEYESYKRLITETYPNGMLSIVSDTYDFWKIIGETLPSLKEEIMARDGKIVIRPDSGDPVEIICGKNIIDLTNPRYPDEKPEDMMDYFVNELEHMDLCGDGYCGKSEYSFKFKLSDKYYIMKIGVEYDRHDKRYYYIYETNLISVEEYQPKLEDIGLIEALWNTFGGTINELGYKVLDPHIGAIYGDSITLERASKIFAGLKEKGFASSNIVLGIGAFSYQMTTRDTFGFAMKATYAQVDGIERLIYKDPKTDDGTKKSQRGLVAVLRDENGKIFSQDGHDMESYAVDELHHFDLLEDVFIDGELVREQSLSDIRGILAGA